MVGHPNCSHIRRWQTVTSALESFTERDTGTANERPEEERERKVELFTARGLTEKAAPEGGYI